MPTTPPPVAFTTASPLAWQRMVSRSFVPLVVDELAEPFFGNIRGRSAGGVFFSRVCVTPHEVHRTPALIDASERLFYKLTLTVQGTGELTQDGRTAFMLPGSVSVYDTSRAYRLRFQDSVDAVVVMFPRDLIDASPEHVRAITALSLGADEPLARLVTPFLAELSEDFEAIEGPAAARVVRTAMDLIGALLSTAALAKMDDRMHRHLPLILRVREHILANLGDPELGPDSIARAVFVSTRHLHELFREQGTTVSAWIRKQRIQAICRDLENPMLAHRQISQIANAWGYADASHFSRSFRRALGVSPSAYRNAALTGGGSSLADAHTDVFVSTTG
ncbi:AraC-like ligand-binding domain-containing protein [Enemella evansiae]|uniref:AraC-like ligand-binding domain-containing protein n=1 Tax=Enemella evansiae TaxID=2016499 RepID=UPI000B961E03|nr:helix-turn-helix domain-containing protein [Enemella evansiae]OYN96204.1 AraC family transcriptional regulator [Enemella evansiae]OYN99577.1 AraC family transcriptional regulator [Enemella evansiae]